MSRGYPVDADSTLTLRIFHAGKSRNPYSGIVMRGAFVVKLRETTQYSQLEGWVEEVDTGKQTRFDSDHELIGFLRERLAHIRQSYEQKEGTNERKDDRH